MRHFFTLLFFVLNTCMPTYAADRVISGDIVEGIASDKNYLGNKHHFEVNAAGWTGYDDAAATPVDGTGGTVTTTCTRTTTTPLSGSGSFLFTPAALGEGCAVTFTIDKKDKYKVLQGSFEYSISSGTYTDNDTTVYLYDVTNNTGVPIQPAPYQLKNHSLDSETFNFEFQATSGTQYRLMIHQATAGTAVLKMDNFKIGRTAKAYGSPVTDWVSYTPTVSNMSGTQRTAMWRRVGDSMEIVGAFTSNNTVSGTIAVSIPSGYTIDTAKIYAAQISALGNARADDATGNIYTGTVFYNSTTNVNFIGPNTSGRWGTAVPFTWATGDEISWEFKVPITGWSSSAVMSQDANTTVVASNAYLSANVTTVNTNASEIKVAFNTKAYDTHGQFDTSNNRYTAPVPGIYRFSGTLNVASTNVLNNLYYLTLKKNGSAAQYLTAVTPGATTAFNMAYSTSISLNAGDYVELWFFGQGNNSASNLTFNGTSTGSNMVVEKLSGPSQILASDTVAALYTGAPPTGTLNSSYNTTTFGTKVKDTHNAYSSGTYTVPVSGTYSISAQTSQAATYSAGQFGAVSIHVNGSNVYAGVENAGGANGTLYPLVSVHSIPLLAGDLVTIRSSNSGTTPTFSSTAFLNYFSIVRTGNY